MFHPNHVGKIDPGPQILDWLEGAILAEKGPVFLENPLEGAAARTSIQPCGDLVASFWICRREEPDVELSCRNGSGRYGQ